MLNDPHEQWERIGASDPYYGVLTSPRYHRDQLDGESRARFFELGEQSVANLTAAIEGLTGAPVDGRRAIDYGCGVGRLTLPLAARCEHVYGVDVSPSMLREAAGNAEQRGVTNVEWIDSGGLEELSGGYDLVISLATFQHIPTREGERILSTLVRGLRPGGVCAIQFSLRPSNPMVGALRWVRKSVPLAPNISNVLEGNPWSTPHMQLNTYSLNRLGRLLADAGVRDWNVRFLEARKWRTCDMATLVFRRD